MMRGCIADNSDFGGVLAKHDSWRYQNLGFGSYEFYPDGFLSKGGILGVVGV